jgi:hypothetical protein
MVTGPLTREPIHRNTKRKGNRNELGWVITDRGGLLVPFRGENITGDEQMARVIILKIMHNIP